MSPINSKSTLQNRWGNINKVLSNLIHKYNEWSFILTFIFNLHLKNIFELKKPPHLLIYWWRNQLTELLWQKNENNTWIWKKFWKKYLHLYLKLDSGIVFSFWLCKSSNWFLCKWTSNNIVLVITCLGGWFGINCPSAFSKILKSHE